MRTPERKEPQRCGRNSSNWISLVSRASPAGTGACSAMRPIPRQQEPHGGVARSRQGYSGWKDKLNPVSPVLNWWFMKRSDTYIFSI